MGGRPREKVLGLVAERLLKLTRIARSRGQSAYISSDLSPFMLICLLQ